MVKFVDASFFYSRYKNFISPLRIIHNFYPADAPYIPEQVTSIGDDFIYDFNARNLSVIYSYTSTSGASIYGTDIMIKYNFLDDVVVSTGLSLYDNLEFDNSEDIESNIYDGLEADSINNDTLRYFVENSLKSFSFQPGSYFLTHLKIRVL